MTDELFRKTLQEEKTLYLGNDRASIRAMKRSRHRRYIIWRYLYYFRLCQYYRALREDAATSRMKRRIAKIRFRHYNKKRNLFSERAGVEIGLDCRIGLCPDIWHGGVIVNGTLGDHCVLHGNNVIGNKGRGRENETPVIGSHADIGAGAVVIGGVTVADRCRIGAGAVVTKSCDTPDSILAGVPAKIIANTHSENTEG